MSASRQGTASTSNSMMWKLGITAHRCALISVDKGPLELCEATLISYASIIAAMR